MNLEKITVTMKDGHFAEWEMGEWSDYIYDGKFFIVMKNGIRLAFYNLDEVRTIIVE